MKSFNNRFKNSFTLNNKTHYACLFDLHVTCGYFLCQDFKINIFFKRGKMKIYQYFDYSVLEKNAPIKKSKT